MPMEVSSYSTFFAALQNVISLFQRYAIRSHHQLLSFGHGLGKKQHKYSVISKGTPHSTRNQAGDNILWTLTTSVVRVGVLHTFYKPNGQKLFL